MEGPTGAAPETLQLVIQVVDASGPVVDAGDDTEFHCSLDVAGAEGSRRFVTRGRRGPSPAWGDAFALPLSDVQPAGGAAAAAPAGAARAGLLTVRVTTRKLLRSEASLAAGELPLDALAAALAAGAPPLTQAVHLTAGAAPKPAARSPRAGRADQVLLRLAVAAAPPAPPGLRGAAAVALGRGRAAGCCASALAAVGGASLHVPQGVLLESPPLQHIKLTLHAATGLEQLHLEPAAALTAAASLAAAEAAGGGGGSGGGGGTLLDKGASWLQARGKGSRLAGVVAAAAWAAAKRPGAQVAVVDQPRPPPEAAGAAAAEGLAQAEAASASGSAADAEAEAAASPPGASAAQRPWLAPGDDAQRQQDGARGGVGGRGRHKSVGSVEREVLMGLLEDNGFHTTDAPGGAFFYVRMSCAAATDAAPSAAASLTGGAAPPPGAAATTRMVPLCGLNGCAAWEQAFWFAVPRPAEAGAKVELELMASPDKKQRGRSVAKLEVPLFQLLHPSALVRGGAPARRFAGGGPGRPGRGAGGGGGGGDEAPVWEHQLTGLFWEKLPFTFYVSVTAADADHRAAAAGLPRALPPLCAADADAAPQSHPLARASSPAPPAQAAGSSPKTAAGALPPSPAAARRGSGELQPPVAAAGAAAAQRRSGELQRAGSDASGSSSAAGGSPAAVNRSSIEAADPNFGSLAWAATFQGAGAAAAAAAEEEAAAEAAEAAGLAGGSPGGGRAASGLGPLPPSPSAMWGRSSSKGSLAAAAPSGGAQGRVASPGPDEPPAAAPPGGEPGTGGAGGARAAGAALAALGPPYCGPEVVAACEVVVHGFELSKPSDCFFVLQLGPYWAISTTSHSTAHPTWNWHLLLPVWDPAALMSIALFRRDDQSGGKKVMTMRSVFGDSLRMVGKLRVRLSTLAPNQPVNVRLPMQGERSNLKGGRPRAATAELFLLLRAPSRGAWLRGYVRVPIPRPLYLAAVLGDPPQSADALSLAERRSAARWLLDRLPYGQQQQLHARALARVMDDGRGEFTLSRTRHNWRRLIAARTWVAGTVGAAFEHVCTWENPAHSGGVAATCVLLGVYPSQVLAALLVVLAVLLWRSGGAGGASGPPRPPHMEGDIATADEGGGGDDGGSAVPADPYSALKQNYDAVVQFTTTVQNVLDGWAASIERIQALVTWRDPTASAVLMAGLLAYAAALWVLGLRPLVTLGLLWVFRPPALRDPCPPPPVNFVARLPNRSDVTL